MRRCAKFCLNYPFILFIPPHPSQLIDFFSPRQLFHRRGSGKNFNRIIKIFVSRLRPSFILAFVSGISCQDKFPQLFDTLLNLVCGQFQIGSAG